MSHQRRFAGKIHCWVSRASPRIGPLLNAVTDTRLWIVSPGQDQAVFVEHHGEIEAQPVLVLLERVEDRHRVAGFRGLGEVGGQQPIRGENTGDELQLTVAVLL